MKAVNYLYGFAIFLLCSCEKSAPDAYVIKAGMDRDQVEEALNSVGLNMPDDDNDDFSNSGSVEIEENIDYFGVEWNSFEISFNQEGRVYKVAFFKKTDENRLDSYNLISKISEELGKESGGGILTTWSNGDKWLVSFANNKPPYPKNLTYWYKEYMNDDEPTDSEN